jgi:heat-inducible transcriptional repressor
VKPITLRKPSKDQREKQVLLSLVELYLQTGKPVGSATLQEFGFRHLSSATIRNYFAKLEQEGFLKQAHSSGGRTPTAQGFQLYADHFLFSPQVKEEERETIKETLIEETQHLAQYLQQTAEKTSQATRCSVFLSAPRFDQDFVLDIRLLAIDPTRCLCALISNFGLIQTEVLYSEQLKEVDLNQIERFLRWKILSSNRPEVTVEEEILALRFYNEVMLRHLVSYTHFTEEELYKTGFSKLLQYPDFNDTQALASGLSLFENSTTLKSLLRECCHLGRMCCWVGCDSLGSSSCSIIAIPYRINQIPVGAIAILGPQRIPYRRLFGILEVTSHCISETLTKSIYKFKISYRQPKPTFNPDLLKSPHGLFLEDQQLQEQPYEE